MNVLAGVFVAVLLGGVSDHESHSISPEKALQTLRAGNKRFVSGKTRHPHQSLAHMHSLERGQHPIAVVVGCSDSRCTPEIIFDQGLGDIFVVREAGTYVDPEGLGSIQYAVEHLGARLVMVLGHTECGAVKAALGNSHEHGEIPVVLDPIRENIKSRIDETGNTVTNAVLANVRKTIEAIHKTDPYLEGVIKKNHVSIVGAVYDMHTGKVAEIDPVGHLHLGPVANNKRIGLSSHEHQTGQTGKHRDVKRSRVSHRRSRH